MADPVPTLIDDLQPNSQPVLQILQVFAIQFESKSVYKLLLNDGQRTIEAYVLKKQVKLLMRSGQMNPHSMVQLNQWVPNSGGYLWIDDMTYISNTGARYVRPHVSPNIFSDSVPITSEAKITSVSSAQQDMLDKVARVAAFATSQIADDDDDDNGGGGGGGGDDDESVTSLSQQLEKDLSLRRRMKTSVGSTQKNTSRSRSRSRSRSFSRSRSRSPSGKSSVLNIQLPFGFVTCCFNYLRKRSAPPVQLQQPIQFEENGGIWVNKAELEQIIHNEMMHRPSQFKPSKKDEYQKSTTSSSSAAAPNAIPLGSNTHDNVIYDI